jgi:hypothetical protein
MGNIFNNGGYVGVQASYAIRDVPASSFSFVDSSGVTNNRTLTIPATAQSGDIAVIADNINTAGTTTAPSGWTLISSDSVGSNITLTSYYKVLNSADPGSTVTSPDTSTTDHFMLCVVFRPNTLSFISGVTVNGLSGQATTGDPTTKTSSMSGSATPTIGFIVFAQRGSNNAAMNITTTPSGDGFASTLDESSRNVLRTYYKIYDFGSTPENMTGDLGDSGAQAIQAWHLTFTSRDQINYNPGIWSLEAVTKFLKQ